MTYSGDLARVPMHRRRPAFLEADINREHAHTLKFPMPPLGYRYEGGMSNYMFLGPDGEHFPASQLLESGVPLRILDIGTGQGAFVRRALEMGHIAHGLTMHDYRGTRAAGIAESLPPESYIIGNVEKLADTDGLLDQYDIVMSSKTFWWLADPLGALEQAADRVAAGGLLLIDSLPIGDGLRSDEYRLESDVGSIAVKAELLRAGFDRTTLVQGGRLKDIYASRPHAVGHAVAKTAFAFDYQPSTPNGPGWRYGMCSR